MQDRETGLVRVPRRAGAGAEPTEPADGRALQIQGQAAGPSADRQREAGAPEGRPVAQPHRRRAAGSAAAAGRLVGDGQGGTGPRSEEHTSELQSLMRISYAVFCLKKKTHTQEHMNTKPSRMRVIVVTNVTNDRTSIMWQ